MRDGTRGLFKGLFASVVGIMPFIGIKMAFLQSVTITNPNEKMYLTHESLPLKFISDPRDSQMFG